MHGNPIHVHVHVTYSEVPSHASELPNNGGDVGGALSESALGTVYTTEASFARPIVLYRYVGRLVCLPFKAMSSARKHPHMRMQT